MRVRPGGDVVEEVKDGKGGGGRDEEMVDGKRPEERMDGKRAEERMYDKRVEAEAERSAESTIYEEKVER